MPNPKNIKIFNRDNWECFYCGKKLAYGITRDVEPTIDHLDVLVRKYGRNGKNVVCCCRRCNSSKGTMSLEEFRLHVYCKQKGNFKVKDYILSVKRFKQKTPPQFLSLIDDLLLRIHQSIEKFRFPGEKRRESKTSDPIRLTGDKVDVPQIKVGNRAGSR